MHWNSRGLQIIINVNYQIVFYKEYILIWSLPCDQQDTLLNILLESLSFTMKVIILFKTIKVQNNVG